MSESELINLEQFGIQSDVDKLERIRSYDSTDIVDDVFVEDLIKAYFSKVREPFIPDSVEVTEMFVKGDSDHTHVNEKELVSGLARANLQNQLVDFEFGIYCGRKDGEYVYDTLEVELKNFAE